MPILIASDPDLVPNVLIRIRNTTLHQGDRASSGRLGDGRTNHRRRRKKCAKSVNMNWKNPNFCKG
jgi:hypothetical protein